MKFLDWLKQQLGEELYNKLLASGGEDVVKKISEKIGDKKFIEDDGKLIPKSRFDEVNAKLNDPETGIKAVSDKFAKLQKDYDTLKANGDSSKTEVEKQLEALTKQFTELKTASDQKDSLLVQEKKNSAVTSMLTDAKANPKYLSLLKKEIDLNKIELDENGAIKGKDDLIKPILENFKDLFGEKKLTGMQPGSGDNTTPLAAMDPVDYYASKAKNKTEI